MDSESATVTPDSPDQLASMRAEYEALKRSRYWESYGFFGSFICFCAALIGYDQASKAPSGLWILLPGLAVVGCVACVAWLAKARGRHPAWGLLGIIGAFLLMLMPSPHAHRQDELEFHLQGKLGTNSSQDRTNVLTMTVLCAASAIFQARQKQEKPPLPSLAGTAILAWGQFSRVQLPPGWSVVKVTDLSTDYAVVSPASVKLTVAKPRPKVGGENLAGFADRLRREVATRDQLAAPVEMRPVSLLTQSGYGCEYRSRDQSTHLVCCWERGSQFWVAEAVGDNEAISLTRRELLHLIGSISPK